MEYDSSSDDEDMMAMEEELARYGEIRNQLPRQPVNEARPREMEDDDSSSDDESGSDDDSGSDNEEMRMIEEEMARYGQPGILLPREPRNEANIADNIFKECSGPATTSTEECRICAKKAEHPIGCTLCKKLVGCLTCCKQWAQSSMERAGKATCPLCRNEWTSSASVEEVVAEGK